MSIPLRSIKFWINAFIPGKIASLTTPVPKGVHAGKTMIPGPTAISDCFLTDQRTFSNAIRAKSRMHSECKVSLSGSTVQFSESHNCDETVELDCEDGDVECRGHGRTTTMRFKSPPNLNVIKPFKISLKGESNNPCHSGSPDIDYEGVLTIDLGARSIQFDGKVDAFPAFEAYATINDGAGVALFQVLPKAGNTPWNLPGTANVPVRGKLRDVSGNGMLQKVP